MQQKNIDKLRSDLYQILKKKLLYFGYPNLKSKGFCRQINDRIEKNKLFRFGFSYTNSKNKK